MLHPQEIVVDHTRSNGSSRPFVVNLNVSSGGDETGEPVSTTENETGGLDISLLLGRVLQGDLQKNEPTSKLLQNTYGLKRRVRG